MKTNAAVVKRLAVATTLTGTLLSIPILASAHFGHEQLSIGKHDEHVKNLQKVLKQEGYYKLSKPTSYFGSATEKAVKRFQTDHDLKVDGLVGPKTKTELNKYVKYDGQLLTYGDKGEEVEDVQDHLNSLGYYNGHIDGIYGSLTRLAVLRFQKTNDLKIDGIVGPETFKALHASPKAAVHKEVKKVKKTEQKTSRSKTASVAKVMYMNSTAYTAFCSGCSGTTATGINLRAHPDAKVVAVDPSVIPLGTKLYVEGYGYAVAGDTGGAINGKRIDIFLPKRSEALQWGRRTVKVKILD